MIELREITRENYRTCCNLKVRNDQLNLVAPNTFSLVQSKYEPECIPLAIYNNDEMVGFLMYCINAEVGQYWIYRLMIDECYQRKGYAHEAMRQLIQTITTDRTHNKIYIDTRHDNIVAQSLYEKLGFVRTDEFDEQEVYMRLDY